jgi:hypothetical protein
LLGPLTAIHAADDLSGDRVTAGALGLSQAPLPALHAAGATTSQEIDRETLVMERKDNGETRWSVEFE